MPCESRGTSRTALPAGLCPFRLSVARTANRVRSGTAPRPPFLRPVLRGRSSPAELVITFDFWREEHLLEHPEPAGAVFAAEVRIGEVVGILDELTEVVGDG